MLVRVPRVRPTPGEDGPAQIENPEAPQTVLLDAQRNIPSMLRGFRARKAQICRSEFARTEEIHPHVDVGHARTADGIVVFAILVQAETRMMPLVAKEARLADRKGPGPLAHARPGIILPCLIKARKIEPGALQVSSLCLMDEVPLWSLPRSRREVYLPPLLPHVNTSGNVAPCAGDPARGTLFHKALENELPPEGSQ